MLPSRTSESSGFITISAGEGGGGGGGGEGGGGEEEEKKEEEEEEEEEEEKEEEEEEEEEEGGMVLQVKQNSRCLLTTCTYHNYWKAQHSIARMGGVTKHAFLPSQGDNR